MGYSRAFLPTHPNFPQFRNPAQLMRGPWASGLGWWLCLDLLSLAPFLDIELIIFHQQLAWVSFHWHLWVGLAWPKK